MYVFASGQYCSPSFNWQHPEPTHVSSYRQNNERQGKRDPCQD